MVGTSSSLSPFIRLWRALWRAWRSSKQLPDRPATQPHLLGYGMVAETVSPQSCDCICLTITTSKRRFLASSIPLYCPTQFLDSWLNIANHQFYRSTENSARFESPLL